MQGDGYFPITDPNGNILYTRDGAFSLNAEGIIVTGNGLVVGDGIQIPTSIVTLVINESGVVLGEMG